MAGLFLLLAKVHSIVLVFLCLDVTIAQIVFSRRPTCVYCIDNCGAK